MRINPTRIRSGFTLIELTIAMSMGMVISAMVLSLFNLQIAFLKLYEKQNFIVDEAPMIALYVNKILSKAHRISVHDTVLDALADRPSSVASSPVVSMTFRRLDGTPVKSILSFEDRGDGRALYYYYYPVLPLGDPGEPRWSVTKRPSKVDFWMENGILRMALEGPLDPKFPDYIPERITFSGTMQQ